MTASGRLQGWGSSPTHSCHPACFRLPHPAAFLPSPSPGGDRHTAGVVWGCSVRRGGAPAPAPSRASQGPGRVEGSTASKQSPGHGRQRDRVLGPVAKVALRRSLVTLHTHLGEQRMWPSQGQKDKWEPHLDSDPSTGGADTCATRHPRRWDRPVAGCLHPPGQLFLPWKGETFSKGD